MLNAFILVAVVLTGIVLMLPRVAGSRLWRATVTPLASIIGSGFLVLGPILTESFGYMALAAMALLCGAAWAFGSAIRFNIGAIDGGRSKDRVIDGLETASSWALAFAYVISVAYYLNLFGAFGVSLTEVDDGFHARALTSAVFFFILALGWTRGFAALERTEQIAVGLKLGIIAGLLVGLAVYFGEKAGQGALETTRPTVTGWAAVTLMFGLLVTVQGFETSRYLGATYDAATRIRSMRHAQILSTLIYVAYVGLMAFALHPAETEFSETAIIDVMRVVAPVLPVLLVAAALSAQLSAAVADTGGSGGLVVELTRKRVSHRQAYALLVAAGLVLTWTADVFEIISYASRAFALYYGLQSVIASRCAFRAGQGQRGGLFAGLALLAAAITVFGTPIE